MGAVALYTPEILTLATQLAQFRLDDGMALRGQARSASCGSSLTVGLRLDDQGRIAQIGLAPQACAIGQAAAAIMATAAVGRGLDGFRQAEASLAAWLSGRGELPDWPAIGILDKARDYPARHGAILLGWRAVIAAFAAA